MPPPLRTELRSVAKDDVSPEAPRTTRREAMIAVGACGCVGCVGVLGRDAITPVDDASAILAERGRSDDARFARVMAGGMRDYESWDEVRAFKKDLFSNVRQGDVVAEIGIGSGPNLQYYGARAKRVVAVEPNLAFEEFVTAEADASRTTLELVQGYAEALPLPDASVDVLVGTMVLCTVNDVTRSLVEARRVLKPGGKYLFTEHTKAPEDWTLLNVAQATSDPLQRVFGSRSRGLSGLLRSSG